MKQIQKNCFFQHFIISGHTTALLFLTNYCARGGVPFAFNSESELMI
jgi:hypothetical protein